MVDVILKHRTNQVLEKPSKVDQLTLVIGYDGRHPSQPLILGPFIAATLWLVLWNTAVIKINIDLFHCISSLQIAHACSPINQTTTSKKGL